jgi:hypothetical protein
MRAVTPPTSSERIVPEPDEPLACGKLVDILVDVGALEPGPQRRRDPGNQLANYSPCQLLASANEALVTEASKCDGGRRRTPSGLGVI